MTVVTLRTRGDGVLHGDGVELVLSPSGDYCGALGCTADERLVRVELDGFDDRVLCTDCAEELLRRERGWA